MRTNSLSVASASLSAKSGEAPPEELQDRGALAGLKAELAGLQQTVAAGVGEK
jgi:hypothetical protein